MCVYVYKMEICILTTLLRKKYCSYYHIRFLSLEFFPPKGQPYGPTCQLLLLFLLSHKQVKLVTSKQITEESFDSPDPFIIYTRNNNCNNTAPIF